MSRRLQGTCAALRMHRLAFLFALLFAVVTTAQAAHLHRPTGQEHHLQAPAAGSQSADAEEHCPLCVAMHPALPAPIHVEPSPVLVKTPSTGLPPDLDVFASWAFARFGRPPPARA